MDNLGNGTPTPTYSEAARKALDNTKKKMTAAYNCSAAKWREEQTRERALERQNYLRAWYPLARDALFQAVCAIGTYGGLAVPRFAALIETVPTGILEQGYVFVVQRTGGGIDARLLTNYIQHALDVIVPSMAVCAPRLTVSNIVYAGTIARVFVIPS